MPFLGSVSNSICHIKLCVALLRDADRVSSFVNSTKVPVVNAWDPVNSRKHLGDRQCTKKSSLLGTPGKEHCWLYTFHQERPCQAIILQLKTGKKEKKRGYAIPYKGQEAANTEWVRMTSDNYPVTLAKLTSKINEMTAVTDRSLSSLQLGVT